MLAASLDAEEIKRTTVAFQVPAALNSASGDSLITRLKLNRGLVETAKRNSAPRTQLRRFVWTSPPGLPWACKMFRGNSLRLTALRLHLLDGNRLHVYELANAVVAQFAPVTGVLHAAERNARVGGHHAVDECQP